MKKFFLLFAFSLLAIGSNFAQVQDSCSPGSIFSQALQSPVSAYTSDEGGNTQYENFYSLTSEIGGITFWGYMWDGSNDCYSPGPQDFTIYFYQDNNGAIGTLVTTITATTTPTETGLLFLNDASILRYEITLPAPVSLSDGWFSIIKSNPTSDPCMFFWLCTYPGDYHSAYVLKTNPSTIHYSTSNRSFCLTEVTSTPVPISNWALGIGIILILGFIIIRNKYSLA